jgi:alkylation response protein AidB-like acyl-CoA dehydrogenase
MDITVPAVPAEYEPFRAEFRAFITRHAPTLLTRPRAGTRTPEDQEDVAALQRWVGALYDAGYRLTRSTADDRDEIRQRIIREELQAAGLPSIVGNTLVEVAIEQFGTEDQQSRFLPQLRSGENIWCQLFSEPNAGSDLAALQTRARREGDVYVIDGQKVWTTWGHWADYGYLLARTNPDVDKHAGITAFAIEMRQPGVEVRPLREITGTSDFNEVFFTGAVVPVHNRIGEEGDGWKIATASLIAERMGAAGVGRNLPELIHDLAGLADHIERSGRPLADDPAVHQDVARLYAEARILKLLGYRTMTRAQRGEATVADAPLQKLFFSELYLATAEKALEMLGSRSVLVEGDARAQEEGRWQDMFLYARAYTIAGGSSEIMRNLIAERALGLPRESTRAR